MEIKASPHFAYFKPSPLLVRIFINHPHFQLPHQIDCYVFKYAFQIIITKQQSLYKYLNVILKEMWDRVFCIEDIYSVAFPHIRPNVN